MLQRLRSRAQGQEGFTLIELLVVILIIGILAAVAIPTFLSQTHKATESNLESSLNTAQQTMETYHSSNQSYPASITAGTTSNPLVSIEPTLKTAFTNGTASGEYDMAVNNTVTAANTGSYTIIGKDPSTANLYFDLNYTPSTGAETRTCNTTATPNTAAAGTGNVTNTGDCSNTGTWGG